MEAWIKWQIRNNRMHERHDLTVDQARDKYRSLVDEPSVSFAQWGAKTAEGNITLGELRRI